VEHDIKGTVLPVLEIFLQDGESIIAQSGELSWITDSIVLHPTAGGLGGALSRLAAGQSFLLSEYRAQGKEGMVAFAAKMPGNFIPLKLAESTYFSHRHGFVAGEKGVSVSVGFQKSFAAGLFGGDGYVLQKISGTGQAWVELSGEVIPYDLKEGDHLRVHPGHVGIFEGSISFTLTTVPGVANKLFGHDGLFLAKLSGPGRVWLQSMPLVNLAAALSDFLPKPRKPES
jgi:uncharacterized protein (TIGR00266 family)